MASWATPEKVRGLLNAGAEVTVLAPEAAGEIETLAAGLFCEPHFLQGLEKASRVDQLESPGGGRDQAQVGQLIDTPGNPLGMAIHLINDFGWENLALASRLLETGG